MDRSLPSSPTLDHMKWEARNLLHGLQQRDSTETLLFNGAFGWVISTETPRRSIHNHS